MAADGFGSLYLVGAAPALIDESGGEVTYAQLAMRCEDVAKKLGTERQLILLQAGNDIDTVVAYVAARAAGHVVILTGEGDDIARARILQAFAPTIVITAGEVTRLRDAPAGLLHPDLAVLLPTSGSTGRPKLVRLSHRNLDANAEAIVEYLEITAQDRAITSLPLCYAYGLSVLNSHLRAGASIVLTEKSVTNPDFWTLFRQQRVSSIAGVPHSYELFERIGLRDDPPESLRVMTQAGGRLAPDMVRAYAAFGADKGIRFYAMYGQTEAAPRIAFLPPELAAENSDCIGVPIPGGALSLVDENGLEITRAEVRGELVYHGPNVMMGYANGFEDLAKGHEVEDLRTGDLAVRTAQGLFRIVGRASRFVKIAGLRIGLDDLEAMLAEAGRTAYVAGSDHAISVCVVGDGDPRAVRELIAQRHGLPAAHVNVIARDEAPRLPNGKIDYLAIRATGEAQAQIGGLAPVGAIATVYAEALGIERPADNATFAELGGDSLSYVNASIGLEKILGVAPAGWEAMPIAALEAMTPSLAPAPTAWRPVSGEIIVRVVALGLVMTAHALNAGWLRGGANILFALAGYSLARFHKDALLRGSIGPPIRSAAYRIVAPYLLCVGIVALRSPAYAGSSLLFISPYIARPADWLSAFWFIQTLMHALVVTCALFLIAPVRRRVAARPFVFSLGLVAGAAVAMSVAPMFWDEHLLMRIRLDAWLYLYLLGWTAYFARTLAQKGLVVVLALVLASVQYGVPNAREIILPLGLAAALFVREAPLPRWLADVVLKLAAGSYFIYLVHVFVWHAILTYGAGVHATLARIGLMWLGAISGGLIFAAAWNFAAPTLRLQLLQAGALLRPPRERRA